MEPFTKSCALCKHRPKDEGGYGDCPLPPVLERQLRQESRHDCGSFDHGDRRIGSRPKRRELHDAHVGTLFEV